MTPEEMNDLYIRIAFHYESAIDQLVGKGLLDKDFADTHRKTFYDSLDKEKLRTTQRIRSHTEIIRRYIRGIIYGDMVSLTELARQYSKDSPGYIIQSWMRSCNTLEFLRQWENDMNGEFDDRACEDLIQQAHTTSLAVTPSLWIRRTHAVGMRVKQGKGGGVSAYPEMGFQPDIFPLFWRKCCFAMILQTASFLSTKGKSAIPPGDVLSSSCPYRRAYRRGS